MSMKWPWRRKPAQITAEEAAEIKASIHRMLKDQHAVIYFDGDGLNLLLPGESVVMSGGKG